ncbi:MAG TPA: hypothetical protein VED00_01360 [archaeon]|nr:hypothetical protein [archaeon]
MTRIIYVKIIDIFREMENIEGKDEPVVVEDVSEEIIVLNDLDDMEENQGK